MLVLRPVQPYLSPGIVNKALPVQFAHRLLIQTQIPQSALSAVARFIEVHDRLQHPRDDEDVGVLSV